MSPRAGGTGIGSGANVGDPDGPLLGRQAAGEHGDVMVDRTLDSLELELRQLPGVVGVGLDQRDGDLVVHLLVSPDEPSHDLRRRASEVGRGHVSGSVVIEIEEGTSAGSAESAVEAAARIRLLSVRRASEGEIEVHLSHGGARTVGRAETDSPTGPVTATIDAIEGFGNPVPFRPKAVATVMVALEHVVVVALERTDQDDKRMGVARSASVEESACRATLDALNRYLSAAGVLA